ncbi:MAG: energy transducer TonB [Pyrinomonadaceae bacterium]
MKPSHFAFIGFFLLLFLFNVVSAQQNTQIQDQPLKILKKPRPHGRDCSQTPVTVRLKVTFDKTAKVTNVEIVESSGCKDFDKRCCKSCQENKIFTGDQKWRAYYARKNS